MWDTAGLTLKPAAAVTTQGGKKPQVPPLRFAPVGMTILLWPQELQGEIPNPAIELSSRPERSVVEGPVVSFPQYTPRSPDTYRALPSGHYIVVRYNYTMSMKGQTGCRQPSSGRWLNSVIVFACFSISARVQLTSSGCSRSNINCCFRSRAHLRVPPRRWVLWPNGLVCATTQPWS